MFVLSVINEVIIEFHFKMNDLMLRKGVDIKSHLKTNMNTMGELNNQIDRLFK